jgi:hypothetical protein
MSLKSQSTLNEAVGKRVQIKSVKSGQFISISSFNVDAILNENGEAEETIFHLEPNEQDPTKYQLVSENNEKYINSAMDEYGIIQFNSFPS